MTNIDKQYWENRWQQHQTGWDLGSVSPPLKIFIDSVHDKNLRILIPGCGNAYEAQYLLDNGFTDITVLDIAPTLVDALKQSFANHPASANLKAVCGDFFEHTGVYDLILEQTFFCAIDPSLRKKYAEQCHSLLADGGKIAGVMFNREFEGGPPFGGTISEYQHYFMPLYSKVIIEPCLTSAPPRLGSEVWVELRK